jgi:transcriptional regulator with XRE-family HTH domain
VSLATFGRDLRARRRSLGLTQAGVAEAVGTRPVIVGRWERGEAIPTLDEVMRLADVLDPDPAMAAEWSTVALPAAPVREAPPTGEIDLGPRRPSRPAWLARLATVAAALRRRPALSRPDGGRAAFPSPGRRHSGESYLDDPVERRRYALRWALTLLVLGALAIGLVWALVELRQGWDAFLDLFRSRPPGSGLTSALSPFLAW